VHGSKTLCVLIGEIARRVGRSVDTIKRWEGLGLLTPDRDALGRRLFREEHVSLCMDLAQLGLAAQRNCVKLSLLVDSVPHQMVLIGKEEDRA
jgi:hypothetical protein